MDAPLRLAVVGCGRITQVAHLPAIEKVPTVTLVALSDPSHGVAASAAARYGIPRVYGSAEKVLADPEIDAVIVAAPDRFHASITSQALRAGKHVLVEKPMASTAAEATVVRDLVAETGLVLQVGAMKRHDPGVAYAARFVDERIGTVRSFNAWYRIGDLRPGIEADLFPRVFVDDSSRATEAEFKEDRQRYLLATHGAHVFDTVRFMVGEIGAVVARHRSDGRDHAWQVLATTERGAVGTITITVDVPGPPSEGIEVFGEAGSVRVDTHFPFYRRASTVHAYSDGQTVSPALTDGDAYEQQVAAFARTIATGGMPTPNATDGLQTLRLIEAVTASAADGSEVAL